MKRTLLWILLATITLSAGSCKKDLTDSNSQGTLGDKVAPDGFDYSTTQTVEVSVRLLTPDDKPLSGVLVSFYDPDNITEGMELLKSLSDKDGYIRTSMTIPSYLQNIVINPSLIGLPGNVKFALSGNTLSAVIGGKSGLTGNYIAETVATTATSMKLSINQTSAESVTYDYDPSKYGVGGRPLSNYLEPKDNIDFSTLLTQITTVLPEKIALDPSSKYLRTEAPADLTITDLADVWITFVHEGADFKNALGYYTYKTGHAPTQLADVGTIHLIFPNASFEGKGGNMVMGDKVKIGRFEPGTSIGFVLLQDAYKSGALNANATKFFTTEALNPEVNDLSKRRHNVLLLHKDNQTKPIFVVGFEDILRTKGPTECDNDFNDLMFYAQSNPVEAISPINIPYVDEASPDADKDGIPDFVDEYPNDPTRAYNRYYPSKEVWGTTAFEDNWPSKGDYDMNDLVVSYRYTFALNAANQVVDMTGEFKPLAAGALFQNGFGVELPVTPDAVQSVTGQKHISNYISLNAKGLENGHTSKSVIIPFDNYRAAFHTQSSYINTLENSSKIDADLVKVYLSFSTLQSDEFTSKAPFNPFMISNLTRGREVHLVNHTPTALADQKLFKTDADHSDASKGRYYVTEDNHPFAIDFFGSFTYPTEKSGIGDAYSHFFEWASSGGTSFADWYADKTGYRNSGKLYSK